MIYLIFFLVFAVICYFIYQYFFDFSGKKSNRQDSLRGAKVDYEKELLLLCYHDKKLVQRLIDIELRKGLSLSEAPESAYLKLLRDRR